MSQERPFQTSTPTDRPERYELALPNGGQLNIVRHDDDNSTVVITQPDGGTVRLGALPVVLPYLEVNGRSQPNPMTIEEVREFNRFLGEITMDGVTEFEGLQVVARVGEIASREGGKGQ